MTNAYIRYPSQIYGQTHPAAIGAMATLLGRKVPPIDAARVLDIGCGEGVNLLAMAIAAPGAEFIGVDIDEPAIAHRADDGDAMRRRQRRLPRPRPLRYRRPLRRLRLHHRPRRLRLDARPCPYGADARHRRAPQASGARLRQLQRAPRRPSQAGRSRHAGDGDGRRRRPGRKARRRARLPRRADRGVVGHGSRRKRAEERGEGDSAQGARGALPRRVLRGLCARNAQPGDRAREALRPRLSLRRRAEHQRRGVLPDGSRSPRCAHAPAATGPASSSSPISATCARSATRSSPAAGRRTLVATPPGCAASGPQRS